MEMFFCSLGFCSSKSKPDIPLFSVLEQMNSSQRGGVFGDGGTFQTLEVRIIGIGASEPPCRCMDLKAFI